MISGGSGVAALALLVISCLHKEVAHDVGGTGEGRLGVVTGKDGFVSLVEADFPGKVQF